MNGLLICKELVIIKNKIRVLTNNRQKFLNALNSDILKELDLVIDVCMD